MANEVQYPDHFIERLHTVWGDGFLSPGGIEEVKAIVIDLDLRGMTILDIGFGTGGPAIVLAGELDAQKVVGIDVEDLLFKRAEDTIRKAGLSKSIDLRLVESGLLPFEDESFDVVFSKDSIIHFPDKNGLFQEILRVLKPGGTFAASDWLRGVGPTAEKAMEDMQAVGHLHFEMATVEEMETQLRSAGFENVGTVDRNKWYAEVVAEEVRQLTGPLYSELVSKVGSKIVDPWLDVRRALAKATIAGGLRPTHLRAFKPVR